MGCMAEDFDRTTTTIAVYRGDAEQLKRLQRQVSDKRDAWVTMPEILHELITKEAGNP